MPQSDVEKLRVQLGEVDKELSKNPDVGEEVLERVCGIMAVASAIDSSRSSFALGQVYEALLPMRTRATLVAKKAKLLKQIAEADLEQV